MVGERVAAGDEHELCPRRLSETCALDEIANVRQRVWNAVAADRRQRAFGSDQGHVPVAHPHERVVKQLCASFQRIGLADQPADLPYALIVRSDVFILTEAMQQRCGNDLGVALGDQALALSNPRIDNVLIRLAL